MIRSTGHAFISFESAAEALRAVSATDKKTVFGNVLDVQLDDALPRVSAGGHRSYRKYGKVRIRNFSSDRYGCREDLKNLFRHYGPVRGLFMLQAVFLDAFSQEGGSVLPSVTHELFRRKGIFGLKLNKRAL